jgi:hypothetical protein
MQTSGAMPNQSNNTNTEKEPLQVRIPVTVKRAFKAQAALRGIEPNQLFVEVWDFYRSKGAATAKRSVHEA